VDAHTTAGLETGATILSSQNHAVTVLETPREFFRSLGSRALTLLGNLSVSFATRRAELKLQRMRHERTTSFQNIHSIRGFIILKFV